jgi:hypothetical protein
MGCGASGRSSGGVGCCAESSWRPSKRAASRRAPLKTLLVISFYKTPCQPKVVSGRTAEAETAALLLDANRAPRMSTAAGENKLSLQEAEHDWPRPVYSRRSFCMMGTLRMMLGRNSNTRLPPASVAIDVRKVRLTTLAVTLGWG